MELLFRDMFKSVLTNEELAAISLREIYEAHGYSFYRMKRFEEYDFYAGKKDFLSSSHILTFNDINGKLMALRPDVTLSIIKNAPQGKFYYDEKVYRVPKNSDTFREIPQVGIEHIGPLNDFDLKEVLELAILSLNTLADGKRFVLDVADAAVVKSLIPEGVNQNEILACLSAKNIHGLKNLHAPDALIDLAENHYVKLDIVETLENIYPQIHVDFSTVSNLNYYNGIVFKGYIEGVHKAVLSGGKYDMGIGAGGAGFAVYLDAIGGLRND